MSTLALVATLILAGQVSPVQDQYSTPGGRQAAPATGLVPINSAPATNSAPPPARSPFNTRSDPYGPPAQTGGTTERIAPLRGSNPAASNGVSPPPFQDAPIAPNATSNNATAGAASAGLKPTAMMRAMLTKPAGSQLSGEPVPLVEVLAGTTSRLEQSQRIEAYWDLCSSVADYYLGLREQEELRRLLQLVPRGGATLQQAVSELAVRVGTSQRAARASQLRLAGWLGRGPSGLPLPADMPHCGSYHSRYEEIFVGRPSPEAEELAQLLPLRYTELKDAAAAVTRAEEWLNSVARSDSDGTSTLRALELLALRRRAFVQITRDYNRRIARYTELSTPGEIGAERLIGMLIKQSNASTATRTSAPAPPPGRQSRKAVDAPPQTFADGWEAASDKRAAASTRDPSVRPASGEAQAGPRRERSLLVSPR